MLENSNLAEFWSGYSMITKGDSKTSNKHFLSLVMNDLDLKICKDWQKRKGGQAEVVKCFDWVS